MGALDHTITLIDAKEKAYRLRVDALLRELRSRVAEAEAAITELEGASSAVTDHGALTGLGDDDHTQYALAGAATSSRLTQATARLLGRTTASSGAIEEISVGAGLSLAAGSLSGTVSAYTDEQAQDAVGAMVANSSTVALAYVDATPSLTATVVANSIGDTQLQSVLYELDFTTQANNTLTGTESIDSRNWIVSQEANSTLFRIANGTGLEWDASTTNTAWSNTTTTGTRIQVTWGQLLGTSFDPMGEYAIDIRMGAYTIGVANNAFWAGMISSGTTNSNMAGLRIHNAGGTQGVSFMAPTGTTQLATTPDVLSIRVSQFRVDGYIGTWAAGWPAADSMLYIGSGAPSPPGSGGAVSYLANGGTSGLASSFVMAYSTGETGGTGAAVVRQLRVRRVR